MGRKDYSANTVKLSFWFSEFRKVIMLLNSGKTMDEIKSIILEENLFLAPTEARSLQIFNTVSTRVKTIDQSFYRLFEESDILNQKIIVLISIMESDTLFFDFMYEVYREKLILGNNEIADSDISIFFKDKQLQSERVAKWKDYTLKRLGGCYKTYMMEAGVLEREEGSKKIRKPILDIGLEEKLKDNNMEVILNALTGVR